MDMMHLMFIIPISKVDDFRPASSLQRFIPLITVPSVRVQPLCSVLDINLDKTPADIRDTCLDVSFEFIDSPGSITNLHVLTHTYF